MMQPPPPPPPRKDTSKYKQPKATAKQPVQKPATPPSTDVCQPDPKPLLKKKRPKTGTTAAAAAPNAPRKPSSAVVRRKLARRRRRLRRPPTTRHWGEFTDTSGRRAPADLLGDALPSPEDNRPAVPQGVCLTMDNAIVTQSIEVQNQTEMIQSLIDTYTSNNTGDPCHLMPQIDFPPGTSADLLRATVDDRFAKPLWYIPPVRTAFTAGRPTYSAPATVVRLSAPVVRRALHKSVAGLLRLKGFHESTHTALGALADGVDEFMRSFMAAIGEVMTGEGRDLRRATALDVPTLERGYFALRRASLLSLHNYYKHDVVQRNRRDHRDFQEIYAEYDRLMQESQQLHKRIKPDQDHQYMGEDMVGGGVEGGLDGRGTLGGDGGLVAAGAGGGGLHSVSAVNMLSYLDGSVGDPSVALGTAGFQAIFDANAMVVGPSNATTGEEFQQRYSTAEMKQE